MYSVSMTTRLGLVTVLGAIAVVIIAHSQDRASISNQCKAEHCAIGTNIAQIIPKKVSKSTQEINRSADGAMVVKGSADKPVSKKPWQRLIKKSPLLNNKDKSVQAMVVRGSADKPVRKKPSRRLVKKPKRLVEKPNYGRPRRDDDPFLWRESFN
jgi:hypothetical protein